MTVQPDLFGEYDAARAQRALWDQPHTCPRCGTHEPNGYLLHQNHGIDPGTDNICGYPRGQHPNYGDKCLAQHLVTNHIIYDLRYGTPDLAQPRPRNIQRARQLGLDVDAIIAAEKNRA